MNRNPIRVALAGNPNAGKTTVFNALTGENQHVGNWPGKTVKRIVGHLQHKGRNIEVIDLPGTYSLSSYSPEEEIARDYIVHEKPDVVVNVVDASNLERNLYLTIQIIETNSPLIIVLNMGDIAERRGVHINAKRLSKKFNDFPVIKTIANKNIGIDDLKEAILAFGDQNDEMHTPQLEQETAKT
jgi:ferrous iron transport protein B